MNHHFSSSVSDTEVERNTLVTFTLTSFNDTSQDELVAHTPPDATLTLLGPNGARTTYSHSTLIPVNGQLDGSLTCIVGLAFVGEWIYLWKTASPNPLGFSSGTVTVRDNIS